MCGSYLSSKWFEDEVKIFGGSNLPKAIINVNDYSKKDIQYYLNKFIEDVEEIYFAGGEPLIMDEHYYIMEKLIEIGHTDVRIRYNTNLGYLKFKKWDNLKIWEPFRKVNNDNVAIFASIDGINEVAEYKRKGTKWPVVEANIKKCIDEGLNFHVSCTTSIMNVFHIPTFIDRMVELGLDIFHIQLNNILTNPLYYNINILPVELKDKVKYLYSKHLEKFEGREQEELKIKYDSIFKFMDESPEDNVNKIYAQLKSMTDKIDKGRNENFLEIYPYYTEWYNSIGKSKL
jgi:MoaA/NifB/PqqE/SkfB family radical SAM enzyme